MLHWQQYVGNSKPLGHVHCCIECWRCSLPCIQATTTDLYSKTAAERARFMKAIHKLQASNAELVPVVAAITFAAPRVGNPSYANTFKARSLINPLWVAEPLFNDKYTCGGKVCEETGRAAEQNAGCHACVTLSACVTIAFSHPDIGLGAS